MPRRTRNSGNTDTKPTAKQNQDPKLPPKTDPNTDPNADAKDEADTQAPNPEDPSQEPEKDPKDVEGEGENPEGENSGGQNPPDEQQQTTDLPDAVPEEGRSDQTQCPKCGRWGCPAQRTMGDVQYRKCGSCGFTFKTVRLTNGKVEFRA